MTSEPTPTFGTELSTDRLRLRRFIAADAENLFKLDADPEVMRFITGGAGTPRPTIEQQILPRFIREQDEAGIFGFWAAEHQRSFVGWFSLRALEGLPGEAALGYRFCRAAWGQGLATEGARRLVDRGFQQGGLDRIVATTYEENLGSIRVMQKLGMWFVRSFRLDAAGIAGMDTAEADPANAFPGVDVEYAIDRSNWLAVEHAP
jgi:RimJ/RimL family protein N-acetyltransferase